MTALSCLGIGVAFSLAVALLVFAGMVIGFARAIYVVLAEGHVIDTIVQGLFTPIAHLPVALSAVGMMAVHTLVHVPVPSVSAPDPAFTRNASAWPWWE